MGATAGSIRAGRAFVELFADDTKLQTALKRAQTNLLSFSDFVRTVGLRISGLGVALSLPFVKATDSYAKFSDAMLVVGAVTSATDAEFKKITETARRLGQTTSFAALSVAELMQELGKAGFTASQVDRMTASVLNLARASKTDAPVAAKILASTLRQFDRGASGAANVANILAKAANASATSVESIGQSLEYAGATSAQMGMSLERTVAIIGTLGNVGILGSEAGTAIRRLSSITASEADKMAGVFGTAFKDSRGNAIPLIDVLEKINKSTANLGSSDRMKKYNDAFGILGITSAIAIGRTAGSVRDLEKQLVGVGDYAAQAAKRMDSDIGGSLRFLISAFKDVELSIGKALAPELVPLIGDLTKALKSLSAYATEHPDVIVNMAKMALFTAGVGSALLAVGVSGGLVALNLRGIGYALHAALTPARLLSSAMGGVLAVMSKGERLSSGFARALASTVRLPGLGGKSRGVGGKITKGDVGRQASVVLVNRTRGAGDPALKTAKAGIMGGWSQAMAPFAAMRAAKEEKAAAEEKAAEQRAKDEAKVAKAAKKGKKKKRKSADTEIGDDGPNKEFRYSHGWKAPKNQKPSTKSSRLKSAMSAAAVVSVFVTNWPGTGLAAVATTSPPLPPTSGPAVVAQSTAKTATSNQRPFDSLRVRGRLPLGNQDLVDSDTDYSMSMPTPAPALKKRRGFGSLTKEKLEKLQADNAKFEAEVDAKRAAKKKTAAVAPTPAPALKKRRGFGSLTKEKLEKLQADNAKFEAEVDAKRAAKKKTAAVAPTPAPALIPPTSPASAAVAQQVNAEGPLTARKAERLAKFKATAPVAEPLPVATTGQGFGFGALLAEARRKEELRVSRELSKTIVPDGQSGYLAGKAAIAKQNTEAEKKRQQRPPAFSLLPKPTQPSQVAIRALESQLPKPVSVISTKESRLAKFRASQVPEVSDEEFLAGLMAKRAADEAAAKAAASPAMAYQMPPVVEPQPKPAAINPLMAKLSPKPNIAAGMSVAADEGWKQQNAAAIAAQDAAKAARSKPKRSAVPGFGAAFSQPESPPTKTEKTTGTTPTKEKCPCPTPHLIKLVALTKSMDSSLKKLLAGVKSSGFGGIAGSKVGAKRNRKSGAGLPTLEHADLSTEMYGPPAPAAPPNVAAPVLSWWGKLKAHIATIQRSATPVSLSKQLSVKGFDQTVAAITDFETAAGRSFATAIKELPEGQRTGKSGGVKGGGFNRRTGAIRLNPEVATAEIGLHEVGHAVDKRAKDDSRGRDFSKSQADKIAKAEADVAAAQRKVNSNDFKAEADVAAAQRKVNSNDFKRKGQPERPHESQARFKLGQAKITLDNLKRLGQLPPTLKHGESEYASESGVGLIGKIGPALQKAFLGSQGASKTEGGKANAAMVEAAEKAVEKARFRLLATEPGTEKHNKYAAQYGKEKSNLTDAKASQSSFAEYESSIREVFARTFAAQPLPIQVALSQDEGKGGGLWDTLKEKAGEYWESTKAGAAKVGGYLKGIGTKGIGWVSSAAVMIKDRIAIMATGVAHAFLRAKTVLATAAFASWNAVVRANTLVMGVWRVGYKAAIDGMAASRVVIAGLRTSMGLLAGSPKLVMLGFAALRGAIAATAVTFASLRTLVVLGGVAMRAGMFAAAAGMVAIKNAAIFAGPFVKRVFVAGIAGAVRFLKVIPAMIGGLFNVAVGAGRAALAMARLVAIKGFTALTSGVGLLLNPMTWLAVGAVAVVANWDKIKSTISGVAATGPGKLAGMWNRIKGDAMPTLMGIKDTAITSFGAISEAVKAGDIPGAMQAMWAGLKAIYAEGMGYLQVKWFDLTTWAQDSFNTIQQGAIGFGEKVKQVLDMALFDWFGLRLSDVTKAFADSWAWIVGAATSSADWIQQTWAGMFGDVETTGVGASDVLFHAFEMVRKLVAMDLLIIQKIAGVVAGVADGVLQRMTKAISMANKLTSFIPDSALNMMGAEGQAIKGIRFAAKNPDSSLIPGVAPLRAMRSIGDKDFDFGEAKKNLDQQFEKRSDDRTELKRKAKAGTDPETAARIKAAQEKVAALEAKRIATNATRGADRAKLVEALEKQLATEKESLKTVIKEGQEKRKQREDAEKLAGMPPPEDTGPVAPPTKNMQKMPEGLSPRQQQQWQIKQNIELRKDAFAAKRAQPKQMPFGLSKRQQEVWQSQQRLVARKDSIAERKAGIGEKSAAFAAKKIPNAAAGQGDSGNQNPAVPPVSPAVAPAAIAAGGQSGNARPTAGVPGNEMGAKPTVANGANSPPNTPGSASRVPDGVSWGFAPWESKNRIAAQKAEDAYWTRQTKIMAGMSAIAQKALDAEEKKWNNSTDPEVVAKRKADQAKEQAAKDDQAEIAKGKAAHQKAKARKEAGLWQLSQAPKNESKEAEAARHKKNTEEADKAGFFESDDAEAAHQNALGVAMKSNEFKDRQSADLAEREKNRPKTAAEQVAELTAANQRKEAEKQKRLANNDPVELAKQRKEQADQAAAEKRKAFQKLAAAKPPTELSDKAKALLEKQQAAKTSEWEQISPIPSSADIGPNLDQVRMDFKSRVPDLQASRVQPATSPTSSKLTVASQMGKDQAEVVATIEKTNDQMKMLLDAVRKLEGRFTS